MNQHYIPASHIPARFARESTRHPYKANNCPVEREYKFDGQGGYAKDSGRIPPGAWVGAACVVGLLMWIAIIGAVVGF